MSEVPSPAPAPAPRPSLAMPTLPQVEVFLTKAAAVAGTVESIANYGGLPAWLRATMLAASGVVVAVNHWFNRSAVG